MQLTAELRWFDRDLLPKEITHWFRQDCLGEYLGQPEEREDKYLYLDGADYLGIKVRQGRLEVKWRQTELGIVRFGDRVEGKAEIWVKWSEDFTTDFQPKNDAGWVSVKKVRSQRQYKIIQGESIKSVPTTESIDQGCTIELTELSVNGNAWWSVALEAFGKDDILMAHLQSVASWVFTSYQGPKLQADNSYAYPSWLYVV